MPLSVRHPPYKIPSYSLTGDLLAFMKCGLQYRYNSKGSLPPSTPVQLWFGEFIHAVMEESYLRWNQSRPPFPWSWDPDIREIELNVERRLRARGLYAPPNLFDFRGTDQLLASQRAEASVNVWGREIFPLIAEAEVRLQGIREMPTLQGIPRSNYYEVKGVVDVITSVQINTPTNANNKLIQYLLNDPGVANVIQSHSGSDYEVIIDYKGARRPGQIVVDASNPRRGQPNQDWIAHAWQVLTYAWLRAQQVGSAPVVAGILLYLNELVPSGEDLKSLQTELSFGAGGTDIAPTGSDLAAVRAWQAGHIQLTSAFRDSRSIRVVPVDPSALNHSLTSFDNVVRDIETAVILESTRGDIVPNWPPVPDRRTCTACDFKTYCPSSAQPGPPTVP
jgi:PD-(D/E)XK nuclease superfamily